MTADPYEASGGASRPGSWNRYPYVGGDPVNFGDPKGLQEAMNVACYIDGIQSSCGAMQALVGAGGVGTIVANGVPYTNIPPQMTWDWDTERYIPVTSPAGIYIPEFSLLLNYLGVGSEGQATKYEAARIRNLGRCTATAEQEYGKALEEAKVAWVKFNSWETTIEVVAAKGVLLGVAEGSLVGLPAFAAFSAGDAAMSTALAAVVGGIVGFTEAVGVTALTWWALHPIANAAGIATIEAVFPAFLEIRKERCRDLYGQQ